MSEIGWQPDETRFSMRLGAWEATVRRCRRSVRRVKGDPNRHSRFTWEASVHLGLTEEGDYLHHPCFSGDAYLESYRAFETQEEAQAWAQRVLGRLVEAFDGWATDKARE